MTFERGKVGVGLMVYVSDCDAADDEDLSPKEDSVVVAAKDRMKAFGGFIGQLKTLCLASSYVDIKVR